ncbi:MAG: chain-length determining protein [Prevotella sp.]|nr:chain-length determining protein [Prevotella sp.]
MEDNKGIRLREIDIRKIYNNLLKIKKRLAINMGIAFVVSAFIVMCMPRYYKCSVKLAPESTTSNLGALGSLASNLGFSMPNLNNQDAITPEFYPDVIESVDYTTGMFNVNVKTKDGKIETTYYDYLSNHQQYAWWDNIIGMITGLFDKDDEHGNKTQNTVDPFRLTKKQTDITKMIEHNIQSSVDKKTDVITITVTDQDPLICATIADSAKLRLQEFIIKYRTNKAENDLKQAQKLCAEAKKQYIKAQRIYATFADANDDVILQSVKSKVEELENEMQLKYNAYQMTTQQVQLAQAKLQERTPAFTTLQSATVPIKPAGPKRMIFVAMWVFITFIGTSIYVYRKDI